MRRKRQDVVRYLQDISSDYDVVVVVVVASSGTLDPIQPLLSSFVFLFDARGTQGELWDRSAGAVGSLFNGLCQPATTTGLVCFKFQGGSGVDASFLLILFLLHEWIRCLGRGDLLTTPCLLYSG